MSGQKAPSHAAAPVAMDVAPMEQQAFDRIYNAVRASIVDKKLTGGRITIMITTAMSAVERLGNLSGPEKKDLVLHVLDRIVDEIPVEESEKDAICAALALAPFVIDSIVSAAKGQLGSIDKSSHGKCCGIC